MSFIISFLIHLYGLTDMYNCILNYEMDVIEPHINHLNIEMAPMVAIFFMQPQNQSELQNEMLMHLLCISLWIVFAGLNGWLGMGHG